MPADAADHRPASYPEPEFTDSTDGVRVAWYDHGGDGPLLVLCHATGFCGGVWTPIARRLADRYHCISLDFRGHGRTGLPEGVSLAWAGMGDDLNAVVDTATERFGVDRPVLGVGHSMGGAAMMLAELARPGTLRAAWAFEPIIFPRPDEPGAIDRSPIVEGARRRNPEFDSREAAFERYGSRPPFSGVDREMLRAYVDEGFGDLPDGRVRLRCEPQHEAGVYEQSYCGVFERLDRIDLPFAVAVSGDGERPAEMAPVIAGLHDHIELLEYPDLTHFGPFEQPARIADDIATWFTANL